MVTLVGIQEDFGDVLKNLVELDFDAIEAYETAINRLENKEYRDKLKTFKADHERHIRELSALLRQHDIEPPSGPSLGKQWLTKGKVILANLISDATILKAMLSNEIDTNTAYARVSIHDNIWPDSKEIINRGLKDEKKHKKWLESVL
jgi:bacterioferritin (cytochrome b1)